MIRCDKIKGFHFNKHYTIMVDNRSIIVDKLLYLRAYCGYLVAIKNNEVIKCWSEINKKLIYDISESVKI